MQRRGRMTAPGAVALLVTAAAIAACGGRTGPTGVADGVGAGRGAPSAAASTPSTPSSVEPSPAPALVSASPTGTWADGSGASPVLTMSPVSTAAPDLSELERLLDQLSTAIANDATAPTDEGSPR
jgi:hypothetical protein